jgi:starch synthase/alpha-amylase
MAHKAEAGCAAGILNAPGPGFDPADDKYLAAPYTADTHPAGKAANKRLFQERMGLDPIADAPIFFWPSRLDPIQKGCQLLTEMLFRLVADYWPENLQIAVVANGAYQKHFHDIARQHNVARRIAVRDFNEALSHLGYAASDYLLMPSLFEPCGLPQMIGAIYGSLPVVHDTGGLHDTMTHLDPKRKTGNGFVFETFDSPGLRWAIDQAMAFHRLAPPVRAAQIARVMRESAAQFNHDVTANAYIDIYERMLNRPIVNPF